MSLNMTWILSLMSLSILFLPNYDAFTMHHHLKLEALVPRPVSRNLHQHFIASNTSNNHHNSDHQSHHEKEPKIEKRNNSKKHIMDGTRRSSILSAVALATTTLIQPSIAHAVNTNEQETTITNTALTNKTPISASWKAVDGLNSLDQNQKIVSFDSSAYKAMMDDPSRTPLFEKAIIQRLNNAPNGNGPESQTVLDLGTGPYAVFALIAARAGAGKVYAIEANREAALSARAMITKFGYDDVITVLEGFSNEITLPDNQKADFAVAEIVGSVATEEGAYATILDAHQRLLKEPNDPNSWIPNRIQTYAAPASYTLHNLFQPPSFDWGKLNGEPVRFNCRDEGLQLLSNPVLVEDISFPDIVKDKSTIGPKDVKFSIDGKRIEDNTLVFYEELRRGRLGKDEAENMAKTTGSTFSGVALWPRLILDGDGEIEVNSRGFPSGKHQKSHWQTVLPIMSDIPIPVKAGDEVQVTMNFDVGSGGILKPPSYSIYGNILS
mmetsp:Transcript_253/g.342  ORF Transcript_253/g.342 Transcript_253/m.342 type:complete len:495 (+) Transcript_253:103-1587(+)